MYVSADRQVRWSLCTTENWQLVVGDRLTVDSQEGVSN